MAEIEDSLVMRRSKRSTAGNRMEAALAQFMAEDVGVDVEEDVDFVVEKDEEDAFGSDFESTDEEGAQEDVDAAAERMARETDKGPRKPVGGKTQLERLTEAAHKRHRATFDPELYEVEAEKQKANALAKKQRVAIGAALDAETGEAMVVDNDDAAGGNEEKAKSKSRRQSKRAHTVQNRAAHNERLRKEEEEKKSAVPKKVKPKGPPPTQAELLQRALEMESGNVKEHRNYLATEEEKRKRARLSRTAVDGPLLRWVSKTEKVKVMVETPQQQQPPPPPSPIPTPIRPAASMGPPSTMTYQYGYSYPNMPSVTNAPPSHAYSANAPPYYPYAMMHPVHPQASSSSASVPPSHPTFIYHPYSTPQVPAPAPPPPAPPQLVERTETVAKSYVVHELEQDEDAIMPVWKETMSAMFGDHVKWEELRVYTGKGRPMSRPIQTCPITGEPAKYLDPRTGVPFANIFAFRTLSHILEHKFIWDETLGSYTARVEDVLPVESEPQPAATTKGGTLRKRGTRQSVASAGAGVSASAA
ncbi:YL1 nuclear protein-domain-containing protein [Cristinia sonorae]|uniref:YL1 nuclear protein-domain-containing protein n=1 Tax=Cristinia sonorae TaxID=1940300 RepID=A0A8K0UR79_9AGAR|nr:YL1 nuclear protein-domain-containing protein [Cristinia sonorae]